jgi:hypothetical protein
MKHLDTTLPNIPNTLLSDFDIKRDLRLYIVS